MTSGETRLLPRGDVVLSRTGGEALLVDQAGGSVHVVNHTAARLWELCDSGPTLDELVEAMAVAYQVEAAAIRADVESMVGTLRELGLFQPAPAP